MVVAYDDMSVRQWSGDDGVVQDVVLVGWLVGGAGFAPRATSTEPAAVARALAWATVGRLEGASEQNLVRSIEQCSICGSTVYVSFSGHLVSGITDEECLRARGRVMSEGPGWSVLGHAELWISRPEGAPFVSPSLVAHFVDAHGYEPPRAFVERLLSLTERLGASGVETKVY